MPHNTKEKQSAAELRRYYRRKKIATNLLGDRCVGCGSTENLQFDHIDPVSKEHNVSRIWSLSIEAFLKEVEKCQLLCEECHKTKTASEKMTEDHGTWGMYRRRKCRCQICRDFFNSYKRELRQRKSSSGARI